MTTPTIVFCLSESTSFRHLRPIARRFSSEAEIEFLFLDDVLSRTSQNDEIPDPEVGTVRNGSEYLNSEFLAGINRIERKQPLPEIILQRIVEDNISPQLVYDLDGYIESVEPDLFVSGHDLMPFIKHLIECCYRRNIPTAVVQHGTNRPLLEHPGNMPGVPSLLTPSVDPSMNWFEYLKRRVGFSYGAFVFCNPYVSELYTFGDFFTELIETLRDGYPCFGHTDVLTTGAPEFNPGSVKQYSPEVNSILFLSQWQLELDEWKPDHQEQITTILDHLQHRGHPVTVRPHPKESADKIRKYFSPFEISDSNKLSDDIRAHDLVLTVDSTAIFDAVLQGNPCGILQPPWDSVSFPPFTHRHLVQIEDGCEDIESLASERSSETQQDYLNEFCHVPAMDSSIPFDTPVEYIYERMKNLLDN